ncbi:hypothetical protein EI546_02795 [Aequorivita sp. H23M31]|uniref:Uncharacterized protein n=1 Tax=Aequorivita ciconiae TaxID=2494375 RepID=A0A410G0G4_9FLAO|nr:hypothetical protein [Aequorivita sp. H23M31]QAA80720.1 hypothetical protein EI546_02795 [Aequorivita sp. H23M31]
MTICFGFAQNTNSENSKDPSYNEMENTIEIKDSSFVIAADPKEVYTGLFKDGEPYEGYFKSEDDEIFWVELYQQGKKIQQYSFDILKLLKKMESEDFIGNERFVLDQNGEYRDEKAFNGYFISQVGNGFLTKTYKDGKTTKIVGDMFAMHYYNRYTAELRGKDIFFSYTEAPDSALRIFSKNAKTYIEILVNNKVVGDNHFSYDAILQMQPDFVLKAFKINGQIIGVSTSKDIDFDSHQSMFMLFQRFAVSSQLNSFKYDEPSDILDNLLEILFEEDTDEFDDAKIIAFLTSDEKGAIENGIIWEEENGDQGIYKIYKDGKVIKEGMSTLNDFQNLKYEDLFEFE